MLHGVPAAAPIGLAGHKPKRRPGTVRHRRIDIARKQLVYAAGIKIRRRHAYTFINLVLNPRPRLGNRRSIQPWLRAIESRQRGRLLRRAARRRSVGVRLNILHLPELVEAVPIRVEQQVVSEAVIKNSIAGTQHRLGLFTPGSDCRRKAQRAAQN